MNSTASNARTVLLPAIGDLVLDDTMKRFLDEGGRSILLGETREEYVGRKMSASRCETETECDFLEITNEVTRRVGTSIVALDQEPAGILRLHGLVPQMPGLKDLHAMNSDAIETISKDIARAARKLGITMFLSPIVDVVSGANPWLINRTLGTDPVEVGRIASAFIRGVQSEGIIATAKHFPGHHDIDADPAVSLAAVKGTRADLEPGFIPFRAIIAAGVKAIMTGPAMVPALDPINPSSLSTITIDLLRKEFGFDGLIVSDDIDAKATLRDSTPELCAIAALNAGSDLLLLAAGEHLPHISEAIVEAVERGTLAKARLDEAADRVRRYAL